MGRHCYRSKTKLYVTLTLRRRKQTISMPYLYPPPKTFWFVHVLESRGIAVFSQVGKRFLFFLTCSLSVCSFLDFITTKSMLFFVSIFINWKSTSFHFQEFEDQITNLKFSYHIFLSSVCTIFICWSILQPLRYVSEKWIIIFEEHSCGPKWIWKKII